MKRFNRLWLGAVFTSMSCAYAQMPPTLMLDVEPSVPTSIWARYEASLLSAMRCEAPLSLTSAQLHEMTLDAATDHDNISIVPPRSVRIYQFQVQQIHTAHGEDGRYRYRSASIISTPALWKAIAGERANALNISPGATASLLTISCKDRP